MKWISIKDEMPPKLDEVLFCCLIDDSFTSVGVGYYTGRKTDGDTLVMETDDEYDWAPCSHWMHFPEPPKEPNV